MLILATLLIVFGILPVALSLVISILGFPSLFGIDILPKTKFQSVNSWYHVSMPAPWSNFGGSAIQLISGASKNLTGRREPQFSTLGSEAQSVSKTKWRLAIEFQISNPPLNNEIVIDDLHTRLFEWNAYAPPLLTISFYGDVWLRQDNSILKEKRVYSLPPGDGYIINLLFEATRIEAAPAYGEPPHESEGSVAVAFGLLLDYYSQTPSGIDRRVIPSDCIYLFTYSKQDQEALLQTLDKAEIEALRSRNRGNQEALKFIGRLEEYLTEHKNFQPEPVA